MRDLFIKEAEEALERGIEELFHSARDAQGDEVGPLAGVGNPYVVFANGAIKPEGEPTNRLPSRLEAVRQTIAAVGAHFPSSPHQVLIWRRRPDYHEWDDYRNDELGLNTKAGWSLSCRIAAIPAKVFELDSLG